MGSSWVSAAECNAVRDLAQADADGAPPAAQVEHIMSEKAILAVMDHPFIVKLAATFQGA